MRSQRQSEVEHEQGEDGKDDKYCIHLLSFTFFIRELKEFGEVKGVRAKCYRPLQLPYLGENCLG
jgi:hypothetical protein